MNNLESLRRRNNIKVNAKRCSLSEIISESYKALYACEEDSKLRPIVENHINDVRKNSSDLDSLSNNLAIIQGLVKLGENAKLDVEKRVKTQSNKSVRSLKESCPPKSRRPVAPEEDEDIQDSVDPSQDEDFGELTDEELEELTNHLKEIRAKKATVSESRRGIKCTTRRDMKECKSKKVTEGVASPSWKSIDLSDFRKNCSSKAFFKTLKKMNPQLHEGNALTRQESINLYKATNSAMTQLSVELEHNPEFLSRFQECTSLLVDDVASVLGALKEGKAPSKKTMKSIAEFADALLKESLSFDEIARESYYHYTDEVGRTPTMDDVLQFMFYAYDIPEPDVKDVMGWKNLEASVMSALMRRGLEVKEEEMDESAEDIEIDFEADFDVDPEAEDEEEIELSPEAEEFYQEYADARKELHDELAEEYEETEDPQIQAGLEQDAAEVAILTGEDEEEEESEEDGEEDSEESPEDGESDVESDEDLDITDDELAELKKHLSEMRAARLKESDEAQVGDTITISRDEDYYTSRGYKVNPEGYVVNKKENYGVFVKEYGYMIPHGDYTVLKKKSE